VLYAWHRVSEPSRLPPERLARAVISGVRYIINSPPIRIVLARTLATGIAGGSVAALMPLVARDLLNSGAQTYGILLGAFGIGAVIGALNLSRLRARFSGEASIRLCAMVMGTGVAVVAASRWPLLTGGALLFVGAAWTASVTLFNIGVQLSAPRWVAGRALAAFQAAIAGGIALGSWCWGHISNQVGVEGALLISGAVLFTSPMLGRFMRMPPVGGRNEQAMELIADPDMRLPLSARSGPIVIEIEYRVDPGRARLFYAVMQRVQLSRQRNGAYGWSIARDIADPELWTERYHCPTWHDYLRQRNRSTLSERALQARALEFHLGPGPVRIRRMLERPIGSVRWKDATPDRSSIEGVPLASGP
jgi:Transmembrane secretion effector